MKVKSFEILSKLQQMQMQMQMQMLMMMYWDCLEIGETPLYHINQCIHLQWVGCHNESRRKSKSNILPHSSQGHRSETKVFLPDWFLLNIEGTICSRILFITHRWMSLVSSHLPPYMVLRPEFLFDETTVFLDLRPTHLGGYFLLQYISAVAAFKQGHILKEGGKTAIMDMKE